MTETLLDSKHSNLIPVSSRCPGASHSSSFARISFSSACVPVCSGFTERSPINSRVVTTRPRVQQQQQRVSRLPDLQTCSFFFQLCIIQSAGEAGERAHACSLSLSPALPCSHTHTSTHALDIALASQCVQSCSSGRALLIPQPAM